MPYISDPPKTKVLQQSTVLNQGQTNACTTYSFVGLIDELSLLAGQPLPNINPQSLFEAESKISNFYDINVVLEVLKGANSPYPIHESQIQKVPYVFEGGYQPGIVQAIAQGYPVWIGLRVDLQLDAANGPVAKTGVWTPPTASQDVWVGAHAAFIRGYDLTKMQVNLPAMGVADNSPTLLCQSSWGPQYGQNGCFWMPGYSNGPVTIITEAWVIRLPGQVPVEFSMPAPIHQEVKKPVPSSKPAAVPIHSFQVDVPVSQANDFLLLCKEHKWSVRLK